MMKYNKYQTQVDEEMLSQYPDEVVEQFMDFTTNVEFIRWLISPDRPYAKDCPHDEQGRVIVDITHPHIIEDADYFRKPALHYLKHGCYTMLKPNSNPHSEYRKFWDEEIRRCREGYVRESDGEWVTGFLYWFLNYGPMMVNEIEEGKKKAVRKEGFPFFFEGIYWRFHYLHQAREQGHHAIELAKRGAGKSYSLAAILAHNLILGESAESNKRVVSVLTAYEKEYLSSSRDGTLSKFKPEINFVWTHTPFPRLTLVNSSNDMTWQMGYKDEYGIEKGSLNQVVAVSAKDNPEKLRGKRGWILFEEMGSFKGLLTLYDVTRKSVEDGGYTFACMYLVGTSAEKESDFSSAKTLLYSPEGYNILAVNNVYDKPKQGKPKFGFFFPAYINRLGCFNHDGVSDVTKALLEILKARYDSKYSADPKSVLRVIAEDPITPAEAIIKVRAAYFPISQLNERILQLESDPKAFDDVYIVDIVQKDGELKTIPSNDEPIRKWGVANNTAGAIEIFNMPEKDANGKIFSNRYIVGHDPVDNDQADSSSLSSTFVFDLFTDRIVAEFTGRRPFADDNYEIVRKLCILYNAKCLYESNKKGLYAYFSRMNSLYMLADTPEYLRDKQLVKYSAFGSNCKGVNASAAINDYANNLIRDWLLTPKSVSVKDENGNYVMAEVPNLYFIKSRALLDELVNFAPEVNVDRIRALGMVMLYRQVFMILYQGDLSASNMGKQYGSDLATDAFFEKNYHKREKD